MFFLLKKRSLIPAISYLTYNGLWKKYLKNIRFKKDDHDFELFVRHNFSNLPEYTYTEYNKNFIKEQHLFTSIHKIADSFLEYNLSTQLVYVKRTKMEEWQGLISMMNPTPLIAMILYSNNVNSNTNMASILPTLDFSQFEDHMDGLYDLHIHINGTSETFYSWQKALSNPYKFMNSYNDSIHQKNSLETLLLQDNVTMDEFFDMLETAKIIRNILLMYISNPVQTLPCHIESQNFKDLVRSLSKALKLPQYNSNSYRDEINMWYVLYANQINMPNCIVELVHFYLLAQSQFERMLVQQVNQNGFRQFLYISDNMIRDGYEDLGYYDRLIQLNSYTYQKNQKNTKIEIRISPNRLSQKLERIIKTYTSLIKEKKVQYQLSIVIHFIKFEEPKNYISPVSVEKFAYNKSNLRVQANTLLGSLIPALSNKDIADFFVGLDAAGYELYAPPEVFAPTFRMIRNRFACEKYNKKIGITFHAGEDFTHLLSGIRYIYEVYSFIDYQVGDRIGHANALGLNAKDWRIKLNNVLLIKRGEWLDNLIFFVEKSKATDNKIFEEIKRHWAHIYPNYNNFSNEEILDYGFKAYGLRKYDFESDELETYLKTLKLEPRDQTIIIEIYRSYLFNKAYDEFCEIELEEKFDYYITNLQDIILYEMAQKGIIIESMISSNVRISFYNRYKEHHIIKWLNKKHNMPLVTLASDDPGIFNSNIFIEYSHLFELVNYNEEKFEEYIDILKLNGKKASFLS